MGNKAKDDKAKQDGKTEKQSDLKAVLYREALGDSQLAPQVQYQLLSTKHCRCNAGST